MGVKLARLKGHRQGKIIGLRRVMTDSMEGNVYEARIKGSDGIVRPSHSLFRRKNAPSIGSTVYYRITQSSKPYCHVVLARDLAKMKRNLR